jgi:hypothetical protein
MCVNDEMKYGYTPISPFSSGTKDKECHKHETNCIVHCKSCNILTVIEVLLLLGIVDIVVLFAVVLTEVLSIAIWSSRIESLLLMWP